MERCTTLALVCTSCTRGVQENASISLVVLQSAETMGKVYNLSFGLYFLYTWCTRECCNRLGRTTIYRYSRVNDMFRNTFPMRDNCIMHLSLGEQGQGVRPQLWYVLLVHVVYKRMLQSAWSYSNLQRFWG